MADNENNKWTICNKIILGISVILGICCVGVGLYFIFRELGSTNDSNNSNNNRRMDNKNDTPICSGNYRDHVENSAALVSCNDSIHYCENRDVAGRDVTITCNVSYDVGSGFAMIKYDGVSWFDFIRIVEGYKYINLYGLCVPNASLTYIENQTASSEVLGQKLVCGPLHNNFAACYPSTNITCAGEYAYTPNNTLQILNTTEPSIFSIGGHKLESEGVLHLTTPVGWQRNPCEVDCDKFCDINAILGALGRQLCEEG